MYTLQGDTAPSPFNHGRYYSARKLVPRHVREKGHILFAHLRALWLSLRVGLRCGVYDVVFCDQISTYVPVVRLLAPRTRILFYCHHPDLLLVQPAAAHEPLQLALELGAVLLVQLRMLKRVLVHGRM